MALGYYIMKLGLMTLIGALFLEQLQFLLRITEARNYNQAYGDIGMEDVENDYQNNFDKRNGGSYHEASRNGGGGGGQRSSYRYQQKGSYNGKYQNEYANANQPRRRGEREKVQFQNVEGNYYSRNNRHMEERSSPNGWLMASNIVEERENLGNTTENVEDNLEHKCQIWVPLDALDKYPDAELKQANKIAGSLYIEICCKGYAAIRWRGKTLCRPICENCQNGRCIAPDVCECYDEYVANDNGDCVFTCPMGCQNGKCYLDGSCQCDPGYKLDESRKFCRPICSKGCGQSRLHNCTEPEVCGCIKGYTLTDNDCQPVCQPDCGPGGTCQRPNKCECSPGYDFKDDVCQSDCYQKCDNGICYSRNRCICNPGFTYHERSTQCVPK